MRRKQNDYPQNLYDDIFGVNAENDHVSISDDMQLGLTVALSTLTERERHVLHCKYVDKMSHKEIGTNLGIGEERIRQIKEKALRKLRHPFRAQFIKHGVFETINKESNEAFERGWKVGYDKGYEDASLEAKGINVDSPEAQRAKVLQTELCDLNLSVRAYNCLVRSGMATVADCVALDRASILKIRNLGNRSLLEIATRIRELGLTGTAWDEVM